jgi:hypothetical protein
MVQQRQAVARYRKDSDSDDDADFRVQALPVNSEPLSLDGPPTSADEYLRRVKCDAVAPPCSAMRRADDLAPSADTRRGICPTFSRRQT